MYMRLSVYRVNPDQRDVYFRTLKEEAEQVQVMEPRTRNYQFFQDKDDPNLFFIIAIFEDKEAHIEHINTPHLKGMQQTLEDNGIRPHKVGKWEAFSVVPDDANWR